MLSFNKKASETEMVCKVYHCQNNVLSLTNTNLLMTVTGYNGEKLVFCLYTLVSTVPYKLLANGFHCFCLSLLEEICTPYVSNDEKSRKSCEEKAKILLDKTQ